ncbi:MAG: GHMP kinase [Nanoarchaeota archaeon]|nr:GHMP kinase [Nanoarchaeota archaeon]MBU4086989.1 GHMP kinase [Nanoarchaeota archaeon]
MESSEIFVPGRLCLFGEHSDWAGGHRRQNSEICPGYVVVAQTNQGNHARVERLERSVLSFKSAVLKNSIEMPLDVDSLRKVAEGGGEFSYVAGVALDVVANYNHCSSSGIGIDNYKTDLPIKKGLSSSASICVLAARAFSLVYDLKWTPRRVMEVAYIGETNTPSRCGRMDQACAYSSPVLVKFDGDKMDVEELNVGEDVPISIADLKRGKNTRVILADLNRGFPFHSTDQERLKQDYLGPINYHLVSRAAQALRKGDLERLGGLMSEAQKGFDLYVAPACPELNAPRLHEVLTCKELQEFVYGGKGVGSQGDGTAQFVCKSKEAREKAREILEQKLGCECLDLDLKKNV